MVHFLLLLRALLAVCLISAAILATRYSRRIRPTTYITRTADIPPFDPSFSLSFTTAVALLTCNLPVGDPSSGTHAPLFAIRLTLRYVQLQI